MRRFARTRGAKRSVLILSGVLVVALVTALAAFAASSNTTKSKPFQQSATMFVPYGAEGTPLMTIGHARINVECGGDATQGMTKVRITAVGGTVMLTGLFQSWGPPMVLQAGGSHDTDAIIVTGYGPTGDASSPPVAGANTFAVFDENGPSFSGTAGVVLTSTGCIVTAQVGG